ncbi:MAG: GAF domain-containing protein, partial [Deltaproteobacteria bacterium]
PLILEGEVIGVINVNSLKVHAFSDEDLGFLVSLASQSAQIIKNAKLFDAVRRRAEELGVLFNVGKSITGTLNLGELLRQIVKSTAHLMGTRVCSLMLMNDTRQELIIKAVQGGTRDYIKRPNLKVSESFVGKVVKTGKPLSSIDVREEKGYKHLDLARSEGLCSLLSVPLMLKGKAIGVLNIYKSTPYAFPHNEIQLLKSIADLSAIAIENARLYERIMELEERIRSVEKLGVMGEMAAEVAHEIRSPLTTIKMLISTLSGSNGKDKKIIEEEIERINKMVARLLDYSLPKEPRVEIMDVNKILDEAILLLEHRIKQQKIEVKKSYSKIPPLEADQERLRQAFLNLSLNALDAMPSGGTLTISTSDLGRKSVQVRISDSGNGIPPRVKDKIFLPFITTKEAGLGLGLSIVNRAINEHRGTIKVESHKNKGTTFTIKLPRS